MTNTQSEASKRFETVFVEVARETRDMNEFVNAVVDALAFSLAHIERSAIMSGVDLTAKRAMDQIAEVAISKAEKHKKRYIGKH